MLSQRKFSVDQRQLAKIDVAAMTARGLSRSLLDRQNDIAFDRRNAEANLRTAESRSNRNPMAVPVEIRAAYADADERFRQIQAEMKVANDRSSAIGGLFSKVERYAKSRSKEDLR